MRSLSSSPLTGSDADSSRFAAKYRRYAAARSSATVAMASLVMGSDSIIRSALRRACRLETNGCGVGISAAEFRHGCRLNRHPQRFPLCGLPAVWCIGAFRAPVIDTPRVPKMCNLRPPARNPPVKGSDLSSGERGEFAGGFQAHGRNHAGYDRSSNESGCERRGRREPQSRRNTWGNACGGRADGVKGNRAGKLVEKQLAPQETRYKTTSPGPTHTEIWKYGQEPSQLPLQDRVAWMPAARGL